MPKVTDILIHNFNIILCENTSIISVGDWNVVQNYEKDTLNYVNQNNPKSQELKIIKLPFLSF
jgi:hypothetical protein